MNTTTTTTNTEEKRARRTPEEARATRIEREQNLAAKSMARAVRLKEQTAKAEERVKKALERQYQIESNIPVHRERQEVPVIGDTVAQRVQFDLAKSLKEIGVKHGIDFGDLTPRLTQHGAALSLRIVAHVAGAMKTARRAIGATREATRFLENYKMVGIKPSLLGKEIQLAGEDGNFKVLGMKGRAHDIILQQVGGNEEVKTLTADDFKTRMVAA